MNKLNNNNMQEEIIQEALEPKKEVEKPINLPDPEYKPPLMMTSKKAKHRVATHLTFLKQLTEL